MRRGGGREQAARLFSGNYAADTHTFDAAVLAHEHVCRQEVTWN
jgi:hypothetical protein